MKRSHLYIQIFPFLKIHILVFPLIAASFWGNYYAEYFTAYFYAFLHELGHIAVARLLKTGISHIEILPFGICGKLKSSIIKNPNCEIAVAAAGPSVNLAVISVLFLLNNAISLPAAFYDYSVKTNLALATINLLPAIPLDGGRIFRAYLTKRTNAGLSYSISAKVSFIVGLLLSALSVYALLKGSFNFSGILISAFLLGSFVCEQRNITKNVLREILDYKEKTGPDEFTTSSVIIADESTPARKLLKRLSYDKYHIVCVTDQALNITYFLTEGQIIKNLTENGIRVTLKDVGFIENNFSGT